MNRLLVLGSAGLAIVATTAFAQSPDAAADNPNAIVCQLLDDCPDAANTATVPQKGRAVRQNDTRGFSIARPTAATPAAPAAAPQRSHAPASTASRNRKAVKPPAGQYDLRVNFVSGSAELDPASRKQVTTFATALKDPRLAGRRLRIEGHTDSIGSAASNQDLSERRARTVADMLIGDGIDNSRLDVRGFGATQPLPGLSSRAGANRRVVAILIK